MTLEEAYHEKIIKASKCDFVRFIFQFKGEYYLVEWRYPKWSEPIKIRLL